MILRYVTVKMMTDIQLKIPIRSCLIKVEENKSCMIKEGGKKPQFLLNYGQ